MARILDGKTTAAMIRKDIAGWIKEELQQAPHLAIITVGDDDASKVYVRNKVKAAKEVGIVATHIIITEKEYFSDDFEDNIWEIVDNHDGVILQMPVPYWCDANRILKQIPEVKDVDGLTTFQTGLLHTQSIDALLPCTPAGILELLQAYDLNGGKRQSALVIGRSNLVGRPMAEMLLQDDWTVTVAHSKTSKDELLRLFANADLVVSAAGVKDLITEEDAYQFWKDNRHYFPDSFDFKRHRIIVDVSINRDENGKLCGDFSEEFKQKYSEYYTPVPGGVGPMTVAMLMFNVYEARRRYEWYGKKELIE